MLLVHCKWLRQSRSIAVHYLETLQDGFVELQWPGPYALTGHQELPSNARRNDQVGHVSQLGLHRS
jgi:hypothetical protein